MKTTIDLPDPLFRRAKATAAHRGVSLKTLISKAVENDLAQPKMTVSELLDSLPRVDKETTEQIMRSVAEWDSCDLEFQQQELDGKR